MVAGVFTARAFGGGIVIATALWAASGCFGNETTPFPPGLEPLEEVTVAPPSPQEGNPYPEELVFERGEAPRYDWAMGRGYIHAPLATVYECMHTPDVVVDRRAVDRYRVTLDTESDYEHSFQIHNEVDDVISVEFELDWRLGLVEGTNDRPRVVAATFQKTFGTTLISLMRGSFVAREVDEGVTEIEMVEHINAATGGSEPIAAYLRDAFASIVAHSRGEPLPTY